MRNAFVALICLAQTAAWAAPVRSNEGWAIHPQAAPADWEALIRPGNLAAGLPVKAEPLPNDRHTGSDLRHLTDGVLAGANGRMWTDKRAVGWSYQERARFTLDLGRSVPVGRVAVRFQVIDPKNTIPRTIAVSLSRDGTGYSTVRNLSEKVHPEDNPALTYEPVPAETPGIYAVVMDVGYEARYLRLDFALRGTMVVDEIAVLPAGGPARPLPPAAKSRREHRENVFDRRDQFREMTAPGNLILGKELRYVPAPTQYLNVDEGDALQLTDGKFGERTDERIWFERGCVGWQGPPLMTIFADLGEAAPIDSVVIRLLGGAEQNALEFPDEIRVLLSADGKEYHRVASRRKRGAEDLSDDAYDLPEEKVAWVHNFRIPVGLKARYLALQIAHQKQFAVSDEMAVVKGPKGLPAFRPDPKTRVEIVTDGVAFTPVWETLPVCRNMPLRVRFQREDARSGKAYGGPCRLVLDLPETVKFVNPPGVPLAVEHGGRRFDRHSVAWTGSLGPDIYLQSLLPEGRTDILHAYGDSGRGPENGRAVVWTSLVVPAARVPRRLHVSLSWGDVTWLSKVWPDYFDAQRHLGFNAVGTMPCYWRESDVPAHRTVIAEARRRGFGIIQIESPAGAVARDRGQQETKSILPNGKFGHVCPSYRGRYYREEHDSFARAAVRIEPDLIFYDIEAYWPGAVQEAHLCERCVARFKAGGFADWDAFRAAMGREIHADMKAAVDKALAAAGRPRTIVYGSYRTEPVTPLNDGLFSFGNTYPDLLQMAMPSLYVAGNAATVAANVAANRARMKTNDIVPWLSTGCYGEYDPVRTRDMILEAFANGARGITYYWYGYFDAAHFKYHAEAVDIVAPVEDIFMDGAPLVGLSCSEKRVKVCGMGAGNEMAVLVSNYAGVAAGTKVTVRTPARPGTAVYDLHDGRKVGTADARGAFAAVLGGPHARMYYLGEKYATAAARR